MRVGSFELEVVGEPRKGTFARVHEVKTPTGDRLALKILEGDGKEEVFRGLEADEPMIGPLGEEQGFVPVLAKGVIRGQPYVLMPFYEESLRDRLKERGVLRVEETYQLGRKLAVAISWAHHRKIIHRGLKPENIFFTKVGRPLIADLGVARHVVALRAKARRAAKATRLEEAPFYMAPEEVLLQEEKLTPQADIYSLGAILAECLIEEPPIAQLSIEQRIQERVDENFLPLMARRGDLPLHFASTITVSLMYDHRRRYRDGSLLAHSLGTLTEQRRNELQQLGLRRKKLAQ
jgi:serine/threonine protein kinase